jgi:hypothetical protein
MSFKIEKLTDGKYKINIEIENDGSKKDCIANSLQSVVYALQHYYRESISMYPFEHHNCMKHDKGYNCCPLCTKEI